MNITFFGGIIVYVESARDYTRKNQNERSTKKMKNTEMKSTITQDDMVSSLEAAMKEYFVAKVKREETGISLVLLNGQKFLVEVKSV